MTKRVRIEPYLMPYGSADNADLVTKTGTTVPMSPMPVPADKARPGSLVRRKSNG